MKIKLKGKKIVDAKGEQIYPYPLTYWATLEALSMKTGTIVKNAGKSYEKTFYAPFKEKPKGRMVKYLKFIGDRKALKPLGFKCFKYYASNYIGYHLNEPGSEYTQDVFIWIANPSDCKLGDNNNTQASAHIFEYILRGNKEFQDTGFMKDYHRFTYDNDTDTVVPFDTKKHDSIYVHMEVEKNKGSEEDIDKAIEECLRRYRKIVMHNETYDRLSALPLTDLFEVSMLELRT